MKLPLFARTLLTLLLLASLSACIRDVHLRQGLAIDEGEIARLEPGLTRDQVRFILGAPPVDNLFNPDVWLYPYLQGDLGEIHERRFIRLTFNGEQLREISVEKVPAKALSSPSSALNPSYPAES